MVKKVEGMTRKVSNDKAYPVGDVHSHGAKEGEQDDVHSQKRPRTEDRMMHIICSVVHGKDEENGKEMDE